MLGDKFRLPAPSPSAIAESRLVSMGTCTRLQRVRGEIYVFGGGVTTEYFQKCTRSLSDFRTMQTQGSSLLSWLDPWVRPGIDEESSTSCQSHSPVHDNEVLTVQLLQ